jgi:hypothetical protein
LEQKDGKFLECNTGNELHSKFVKSTTSIAGSRLDNRDVSFGQFGLEVVKTF